MGCAEHHGKARGVAVVPGYRSPVKTGREQEGKWGLAGMKTEIERRITRLEDARPEASTGMTAVERIIADPEQDAWAASDEGIAAEIARRRVSGIFGDGPVIVRRIVETGVRT